MTDTQDFGEEEEVAGGVLNLNERRNLTGGRPQDRAGLPYIRARRPNVDVVEVVRQPVSGALPALCEVHGARQEFPAIRHRLGERQACAEHVHAPKEAAG